MTTTTAEMSEEEKLQAEEERRRKQDAARRAGAVRLNRLLSKIMVGMMPPDDLTVTEWAEQRRRLSSESSAEPGPWRTERTPF